MDITVTDWDFVCNSNAILDTDCCADPECCPYCDTVPCPKPNAVPHFPDLSGREQPRERDRQRD